MDHRGGGHWIYGGQGEEKKHVVREEVAHLVAFAILVFTLRRMAIDLSYRPIINYPFLHFSEFLFFCQQNS